MNTVAIESVEQLQRELQSLQFQQMGINRQPIQLARDALMDAVARHSVDEKYLPQLQSAQRVLAERLAQHDKYADLGEQIAKMEARLQAQQERVRIEQAERADKRLSSAKREYEQAQLQCARAFRALIEQVARSSNTPGASVLTVDFKLHLPSLTPPSWSGTTGEVMAQTTLPFEQEVA